ncbi:MAG: ISAs1 family transposase [Candidatus Omnitrophica bacterium]|nr:ISAs1 family transposase [Candidatus Omnitrophota bacterium]
MSESQAGMSLWEVLGEVPDHRDPSGRRYSLQSVLAITLAAMLSGRSGLAAVARWGRRLTPKGLKSFGVDRKKGPCHATYHNVFKGLDIGALEAALGRWVRGGEFEQESLHLAIDGKRLRGSRTLEGPGVHLLAAYSEALKGVVQELKVSEDSNEIDAALRLLQEIPLSGTVVTGDAMFTQKKICESIVEKGGDYLFTVKTNQPRLRDDIDALFNVPISPLPAGLSG